MFHIMQSQSPMDCRQSNFVGRSHLSLAFVLPVPSQLETYEGLAISIIIEPVLRFPSCHRLIYLAAGYRLKLLLKISQTKSLRSFPSRVFDLFSLSLMMIAHLDNASVLQWSASNPALNGTRCGHILSFFLFASCCC